jgi:hypothetical protein
MPCALFIVARSGGSQEHKLERQTNYMKGLKDTGRKIVEALRRLWQRIHKEPVLVRTFLALLVSAGILELSDAQLDQANAAVMALVFLVSALSARKQVEPLPEEDRPPIGPAKLRRRDRGISDGP